MVYVSVEGRPAEKTVLAKDAIWKMLLKIWELMKQDQTFKFRVKLWTQQFVNENQSMFKHIEKKKDEQPFISTADKKSISLRMFYFIEIYVIFH